MLFSVGSKKDATPLSRPILTFVVGPLRRTTYVGLDPGLINCAYRSQWARARFDYNDTDPRVTVRPAAAGPECLSCLPPVLRPNAALGAVLTGFW